MLHTRLHTPACSGAAAPRCVPHHLNHVRASHRVASTRRPHSSRPSAAAHAATAAEMPPFMPPIIAEIGDPDCQTMARQMRRVPVRLSSLPEKLRTAVVGPTGAELDAQAGPDTPVVVLLHSFDSSCLEWRRLLPRLQSSLSLPVVAVDLVGWGFTDHQAWRRDHDLPVSPALKREHLEAFRQQHLGGRPLVLVGTSLGGTIAADYALAYPEAVKRLVLVDAQGFVDGVPTLPRPLAVLGVQVLRQVWLRNSANQMAYYDKPKFATTDAWRVGRLTTYLPGWLEANVAFINSGGFNMSEQRIKQLTPPSSSCGVLTTRSSPQPGQQVAGSPGPLQVQAGVDTQVRPLTSPGAPGRHGGTHHTVPGGSGATGAVRAGTGTGTGSGAGSRAGAGTGAGRGAGPGTGAGAGTGTGGTGHGIRHWLRLPRDSCWTG